MIGEIFTHTSSGFPLFFLSHIPVPALVKDKKQTHFGRTLAACRSMTSFHDKMTSPCRISAYSGFSCSLFHVFSNIKLGI